MVRKVVLPYYIVPAGTMTAALIQHGHEPGVLGAGRWRGDEAKIYKRILAFVQDNFDIKPARRKVDGQTGLVWTDKEGRRVKIVIDYNVEHPYLTKEMVESFRRERSFEKLEA